MESKKGKRCYIYTRVSTAIQIEGYSLDAQEKKLLEYAKLNEMTVVKKYCDEGIDDIDDVAILKLDDFQEFGTPKHIVNDVFGGRTEYLAAISLIKNNLFGVARV